MKEDRIEYSTVVKIQNEITPDRILEYFNSANDGWFYFDLTIAQENMIRLPNGNMGIIR